MGRNTWLSMEASLKKVIFSQVRDCANYDVGLLVGRYISRESKLLANSVVDW